MKLTWAHPDGNPWEWAETPFGKFILSEGHVRFSPYSERLGHCLGDIWGFPSTSEEVLSMPIEACQWDPSTSAVFLKQKAQEWWDSKLQQLS